MPSLFAHLPQLDALLRDRPLLLSCDFDGTLIPISTTPRDVSLPETTRARIRRLTARPGVHVVMNSGRSIAELRRLVALDTVGYIGNHGLEIDAAGLRDTYDNPAWRTQLGHHLHALAAAVTQHPEITVHDKDVSASVYFGAVPATRRAAAEAACRKCLAGRPGLRITRGAELINLRPDIDAGKGPALRRLWQWLQKETGWTRCIPLHIGDDPSDEEAFRVVCDRGWGIRVGPDQSSSAAAWTLPDPAAVSRLLEYLTERSTA